MQANFSRTQIPLPSIPYQDVPYQGIPYSSVVGQGALSGMGIFTSLPILGPLNDQFRRASMRRRSSKRYRPDKTTQERQPAPRMGLRVTPPKPVVNSPRIPPLDGSPPDGWARPYPSPEVTQGNQNILFRDNRGFSGLLNDPEAQGHGQGQDRVSLRSEELLNLSRPPSYRDIFGLSDSPDGDVTQLPPDNRHLAGGHMTRPPSDHTVKAHSGHITQPVGSAARGHMTCEPPAQPTRAPPPRPVQLPQRDALPDVTAVPSLQRQISGTFFHVVQFQDKFRGTF